MVIARNFWGFLCASGETFSIDSSRSSSNFSLSSNLEETLANDGQISGFLGIC